MCNDFLDLSSECVCVLSRGHPRVIRGCLISRVREEATRMRVFLWCLFVCVVVGNRDCFYALE